MYTLKKLIDKTYQELLDSGLSEKTIYSANWYIWNRLVRIYGNDAIFEEKMVFKYCLDYFNKDIFKNTKTNLSINEKRYIKAFERLIQSNNNIPFKKYDSTPKQLSNKSFILLEEYIEHCRNDGNSVATIENKYTKIKKFMIDINFDNISSEACVNYLNNEKNRISYIEYSIKMRMIRRFLIFCCLKKAISKDILLVWPDSFKNNFGKIIPSVYSAEEIKELLSSANNYLTEDNHLRNYSILVLIAYSGIRVSDVVNLKLSNINWRENIISFIQHKTKRNHVVPLIPEIGNSLIDYITKERHEGSTFLFTKENGEKMIAKSISTIINNYFCISSININGRPYGPHSLRHSLATNLINKSIDAFSIANVLGHSNINSVKIYAKVDLKNLRKCVLEAPYNA